tara:strand:- start:67 stop:519 length:453 start_codon:yes stop_codon:yes gene_type:complete
MQTIDSILIPIDMSDDARNAFYQGISLATKMGAKAHVLYVSEPIRAFDFNKKAYVETKETIEQIEEGVNRRIDDLWKSGGLDAVDRRKVNLLVRGGKAPKEIVDSAAHHKVDLIVMGCGTSGSNLGATTERVVRNAPCSVWVVRTPETED